VILPGFGTLEIADSGAGVPATGSGRMDPPGRKVRFDTASVKDDGLLAETYAERAGLDREEARQQVLELVDAIRFALDRGEAGQVEGAGSFNRDGDGKVRFQVAGDWVVEPGMYGLESMDLLELEEEDPEEEEAVQEGTGPEEDQAPEPGPVAPPPAATPAGTDAAPVRHEPWKDNKQHRKTNLWRIIWGVAALLIVVLLVLILVPTDTFDSFRNRDNEDAVPMETTPSVTPDLPGEQTGGQPAVSEEDPSAGLDIPESEPATVRDDAEATELPVPEVTSDRFFIVAGSFRNLANASELQDRLTAKGYQAEVMMTENRMYRVTAASFADKNEAERALTRIKSEPGMESCWLLANE